jgi:hypothetical protein
MKSARQIQANDIARHAYVGHHHVDRRSCHGHQSLVGVARLDDREAGVTQVLRQHATDQHFIFDNQYDTHEHESLDY